MPTKRPIVEVKVPATPAPFPSTDDLQQLLALAGVPAPNHCAAESRLLAALEGARTALRAAGQQSRAADHNAVLEDIEKASSKLSQQIERLHRYPTAWGAFWRSEVFRPIRTGKQERQVRQVLDRLERAALEARDARFGRPRALGKQNVVNYALGFFVKYSPAVPSGTPTGPFARFSRRFYAVAAGVSAARHGGIDRQIRVAAQRAPLLRERARQMSAKKSRVLS